ncbi:MAG: ABC transporter permease [Ilumatobacteraceae bacterium]
MRARPGSFSRLRFGLDVAIGIAATVLGVVTLLSREWIELVFGVDPDGGSGGLEWAIVIGLFAVAGSAALAARVDWHRRRVAQV